LSIIGDVAGSSGEVDVGTQTTTVAVPKVVMDSTKIKTPTVSVKKKK